MSTAQNVVSSPPSQNLAPGPAGKPVVGNLLEFGKDVLAYMLNLNREYGGVARFKLGLKTAHLVTEPDCVKYILQDNYKNYRKGKPYARARFAFGEGLITTDGDYWRRHRKLVQPAFHPRTLVDFSTIMTDCVGTMLDRWSTNTSEPMNIAGEFRNLAMRIGAGCLFTADIDDDSNWLQESFNEIQMWFSSGSRSGFLIPANAPTPKNLRLRRVMGDIDRVIYRIIAERRRQDTQPNDLLSMLMQARDDDDDSALNDKELRDEVMTLLFAAHESTGSTLTWMLNLVSKYPDVKARLKAEIDEVLGGRTPTFEDIAKLKYTRMVFEETMRLFPAGGLLPRSVHEADTVGGYDIPAGSLVFLSPYVNHRDPRFWNNPEAFDPERFTPENIAKRHKYNFMPFLHGPRQCIGNHFSMAEMVLTAVMLFQRFDCELVPGLQVSTMHLRFNEGMWMQLRPARSAS